MGLSLGIDSVPYREIRGSVDTGDVLLFSGRGVVSTAIKIRTMSRWSHVEMVVVVPEWDMVCSWGSTTLTKLKDIDTGSVRQGVQIVPLSERLRTYEGTVAWRRLVGPREPGRLAALKSLRRNLSGRPYEKNVIELLRSAHDGGPFDNQVEDLSSLFCSEMVAEGEQALGVLSNEVPSNSYDPSDFARDDIETMPGYVFEHPVEIVY